MEVGLAAADVDLEIGQAAQAVADRRDAAVEHRRVADHDDVGAEHGLVGADEVVEVGAPHFLLALEQHLDVHRQPAVLRQVRLDRLHVHEDLALVVDGAAGIELAVAHGGVERRRRPQLDRIHRLHVVVAVEEDRRRALGAEPFGVDHGMAGRLHETRVVQADAGELGRRPLGAAPDVGGVRRQRRDAGNGQVFLQLLDVTVTVDVDVVDDLVHGVGCGAAASATDTTGRGERGQRRRQPRSSRVTTPSSSSLTQMRQDAVVRLREQRRGESGVDAAGDGGRRRVAGRQRLDESAAHAGGDAPGSGR